MASAPLTPPTRAVSPSQYSQPSPERNADRSTARRSLFDIVGSLLRENPAQGSPNLEHGESGTNTPSQYSQPSNRATARRSLLGLVGLLHEESHEELSRPERRTIVDEYPPRLPSLDLPRPRPSFQTIRSPKFTNEASNYPSIPELNVQRSSSGASRRSSTRSRRSSTGSRRSSLHSQRRSSQQLPARGLHYADRPPSYPPVPEDHAIDELPYRHPADPLPDTEEAEDMPDRHPADPLPDTVPGRSYSESTESSSNSGPQRQRKRRFRRTHGPRWVPRHDRGRIWFPTMRYTAVRNKFFHVVITGILTLLVLVIFLALMNTTDGFAQEFRIITILFILIFAVLFVHAALRLAVLIVRVRRDGSLGEPGEDEDASFARVREPIPIVLARDEELGLGGSEAAAPENPADKVRPPPPTYGRWRDSVRVDPNLIHWERNTTSQRPLSEGTIRRPPSYISERDEPIEEPAARSEPWNEKPIRPRTPETEPEPDSEWLRNQAGESVELGGRRYTRIDPRHSWLPQFPQERDQEERLQAMG